MRGQMSVLASKSFLSVACNCLFRSLWTGRYCSEYGPRQTFFETVFFLLYLSSRLYAVISLQTSVKTTTKGVQLLHCLNCFGLLPAIRRQAIFYVSFFWTMIQPRTCPQVGHGGFIRKSCLTCALSNTDFSFSKNSLDTGRKIGIYHSVCTAGKDKRVAARQTLACWILVRQVCHTCLYAWSSSFVLD